MGLKDLLHFAGIPLNPKPPKDELIKVEPELLRDMLHHFILQPEVIQALSGCIIKRDNYHLLDPQIKITAYAEYGKHIEFRLDTNGTNGFTTLKSQYTL